MEIKSIFLNSKQPLFVITIILTFITSIVKCESNKLYTNEFAVSLKQHKCHQISAQSLANRYGFELVGQIGSIDCHYLLRLHRIAKRSADYSQLHHSLLSNDQDVLWVEQQHIKSRVKRDKMYLDVPEHRSQRAAFDDPLWPQMWYLNRGQGLGMNVERVWNQNITGKGVVISILDDGLEKDHPDLVTNYDPVASFDVNDNDHDPMPRYDAEDSNHSGTRNAGVVAATANNSICGVGVAFNAKVGGIRMLDGQVTDAVEAHSLGFNPQHIDIYSACWGPDDDGKTVDGPGKLTTQAMIDGVIKGRRGLGSIFVFASGIGTKHDNCNCDGYTNSILTISISSAAENGKVPWYSEACSSTLATAYSNGDYQQRKIVTTDLHHGCTARHSGTSASGALAAGLFALVLEANPRLTWRDMQHIVVQTANSAPLNAIDWKTNGVGRNVSHSFGYGLLDAGSMIELARDWVTVPMQRICVVKGHSNDYPVHFNDKIELSYVVSCEEVMFLEHVQAKVTLLAPRRGDIHIYLISPAGTRSTLLAKREMDNSTSGFLNWRFMTVHSWGENPNGLWRLEIYHDSKSDSRAILKEWALVLFGTSVNADRRYLNSTLNEDSVKPTVPLPRPIHDLTSILSDNQSKNMHSTNTHKFICKRDWDCKAIDKNRVCVNGKCVCDQRFVENLKSKKCLPTSSLNDNWYQILSESQGHNVHVTSMNNICKRDWDCIVKDNNRVCLKGYCVCDWSFVENSKTKKCSHETGFIFPWYGWLIIFAVIVSLILLCCIKCRKSRSRPKYSLPSCDCDCDSID